MSKAEIFRAAQINTNVPRESAVFADGDFVIKKPTATNAMHIKAWLDKQKDARRVVDKVFQNAKYVKKYFIPKITEVSETDTPYVREERVVGEPVNNKLFAKLTPVQQENIYDALVMFMYDMNHAYPVLNLADKLKQPDDTGYNFDMILKSLEKHITKQESEKINLVYKFLDSHSDMLESYVFFHGDMNENNMFFDAKRNMVSFIDFAESTYESAEYMFNHDLIKLPWLDRDKLIKKYIEINKPYEIRIKSDNNMLALFNALRAIQWTGESLIQQTSNPNMVNVYKKILSGNINDLEKVYNNCINAIQIQQMSNKQYL